MKEACSSCGGPGPLTLVGNAMGFLPMCPTCTERATAPERKSEALASARDEVVRAAVALDAAFTDHEAPDVWSLMAARKLAWADHRAAVAALAKLEGK